MSALPPKADIGTQSRNVRIAPKADMDRDRAGARATGPLQTLDGSNPAFTRLDSFRYREDGFAK
jgi:hypothetical protein